MKKPETDQNSFCVKNDQKLFFILNNSFINIVTFSAHPTKIKHYNFVQKEI